MWVGGTDGGTNGQIILSKSVQSSNDGGGPKSDFQTLLRDRSLTAEGSLYPKEIVIRTSAVLFFILLFVCLFAFCFVAVLFFKFVWKGCACLGNSGKWIRSQHLPEQT